MKNKQESLHILAIFALGFLVYLNSLWVGFIWDDYALVLNNPWIRSFTHLGKIFTSGLSLESGIFYRPLQNVSYLIDFQLFGFDYRGYHLTNVLLHIFSAILFYRLLKKFFIDKAICLFAALLFLVCPLWVETVTYISGRADILMVIFLLLSFIYFIESKTIVSLLFYSAALLSKEASLISPLILLLYIIIFPERNKKQVLALFNFILLAVIYAFLRLNFGCLPALSSPVYPVFLRINFFLTAIPKYILLLIFPHHLHMSYTVNLPGAFWQRGVLAGLFFLLFLLFFSIYFSKKNKPVSFFIAWFLLMLLPNSGIFPINAFFAEHFAYAAALGFFSALVYFLFKIRKKIILVAILGGYLCFFSFITVRYNFIWQEPLQFYQRIIRLSPGSFAAYNNLGVIYLNQGNFMQAEALIKKSILINPDFLEGRLNLARFYYLKGEDEKAIGIAKGVLELNPKNALVFDYLGTFYLKSGQYPLARDSYLKAVALNPDYPPFWLDLYSFYRTLGDGVDAEALKKIIAKKDRFFLGEIYFRDANQLFQNNELSQALELIGKALEINSANADFYNLKGCILKRQGNYSQAYTSLLAALKISPRHYEVYNNLGNLFALLGDFSRAKKNFEKAITLNKNFSDAYFNLGLLYFQQNDFAQAEENFRKAIALFGGHALAEEYLQKMHKE